MNLAEIQDRLRAEGVDGWLFFDHHQRDPLAYRILGLRPTRHVTRRWYYWLPAEGEPVRLVHRIESWMLDALPGGKREYSGWSEQADLLRETLAGAKRVAMQYSPRCMIPYVALVDAGTVELVREAGVEVVSSAALVQYFEARWTDEQYELHREAGRRVDAIRRDAFDRIASQVREGGHVEEIEIAEFIRQRFRDDGLKAEDGPIVAVNAHSGDPHYAPTPDNSAAIKEGDFVLIDLWAKLDQPEAVYYDITWTGYCGQEPPSEIERVFETVRQARDSALEAVDRAVRSKQAIEGCDIDDVARGVIRDAGWGDRFIHRTGHSIGEEVHGNGVNIDNLETRDERPIVPNVCFSIEPGIYLEKFGVRSEINCFVRENGAEATGEVQTKILRLT